MLLLRRLWAKFCYLSLFQSLLQPQRMESVIWLLAALLVVWLDVRQRSSSPWAVAMRGEIASSQGTGVRWSVLTFHLFYLPLSPFRWFGVLFPWERSVWGTSGWSLRTLALLRWSSWVYSCWTRGSCEPTLALSSTSTSEPPSPCGPRGRTHFASSSSAPWSNFSLSWPSPQGLAVTSHFLSQAY